MALFYTPHPRVQEILRKGLRPFPQSRSHDAERGPRSFGRLQQDQDAIRQVLWGTATRIVGRRWSLLHGVQR